MAALVSDGTLDGERFVRKLAWTIWRRSVVSGLVSSTALTVVTVASIPIWLSETVRSRVIPILLLVAVTGFWSAAVIGKIVVTAVTRRAVGWMAESRSPTPVEISRVAGLPRFAGKFLGGSWLIVIPLMLLAVGSLVEGISWGRGLWQAIVLVFGFGALAAGMGAYLLVEQAVRPVLSDVLPSDPDAWPPTIGMTSRLVLASVVVSVAPLVVIGLTFGLLTTDQRAIAGPSILSGCLLFAAIGFAVFAIAGRAITSPLEGLRANVRRVAEGDLHADVEAVEGGEIGLLQVGFNQMLDGLRERERIRDVFGRHVGSDVAQRALETGFATEGEAVRVSVLFVDVVGSTSLTESSTPQHVVATLNEFFDRIVRIVTAEGGLVNKFLGDGALCVFGAPLPQAGHAQHALRAARRLRVELDPIEGLTAGIGVASGDVVAGDVGAADRYEYTVIGDAVNEASRLCDAAKIGPSKVLASDRTIRASGDESSYWLRGETLQLRGKTAPTVTYVPAPV